MFWIDVKRFYRILNPKKINTATGKGMSSLYRYQSDPTDSDPDKKGTPITCDFLIQIVTSNKLNKKKSKKLLQFLVETCGYELKETEYEEIEECCTQQAKKHAVAHSLFSAKNWEALEDNKIDPQEAAALLPLAEEARDRLTKYMSLLRKKINGVKK